ncbi:MAG TPA: bifunctional pyr operon transcriptional regulator/uracil phosphoribosyltransferase, partial [Gammaproteobacteria bacterium]
MSPIDNVDTLIASMAEQLRAQIAARKFNDPAMVGIHTGGVWIAERLHRALGLQIPLGSLDISFYRDDF